MLNTYKAVLQGNRLEWVEEIPEHLAGDQPVAVSVTILEAHPSQGQRMAEALEALARLNSLTHISDPAAWEREGRKDRSLIDRDS
ncbi:MAG TPA: hypothetical protein VG028_05905 [Terriglobia bacterium]|nr:hypothetical protein [Terriglobia bacterium]